MKYSTGTRFNFSVAAGLAESIELQVGKAGELRGLDVSNASFRFLYERPDGSHVTLVLQHGVTAGVLDLALPKMEAGEYPYIITFTDSSGEVGQLLYGVLTVMSTIRAEEIVADANAAQKRVLTVTAGSLHDGPLELRWAASSVAAVYARQAREAALGLEDVREQVREFRVFVADWLNNMETFLVMNPVTGTIWVNGYDTGQPYQGEAGKAPRVNAYGFWEVYENGQWVTLPYHAEGKDGLDGTQVRRLLLDSREKLPTAEERGVYYYTPKDSGSGYDMWCWLDNAGWVCFGGDPYGIATETSLGLVQLGTNQTVTSGAPVGLNAMKRMMVAMATTSVAGVMKPSSDVVSDAGGGTHFNASGNLLTDVATSLTCGSVKISTSTILVDKHGNSYGGPIGFNGSGQLVAQVATTGSFGSIKLGTNYPTDPGAGYRVGIGAYNGEICTAFVPRGALRHWTPKTWSGKMDWINDVSWPSPDSYYTCLLTTKQFTQTPEAGLVLLPASQTGELCGGVHVARNVEDDGSDVVLPASMVREHFARKKGMLTREEVVLKSDPYIAGVVMTEDEYNNLGDRVDPNLVYVLI